MKYICQDCSSNEYSIIPAFIIKDWNFKKFPISKKAHELLSIWQNRPVVHFKSSDPILKKSSLLRQAVIIKRKIHKIFDLMKCDKSESFVLETLSDRKYLVLKENLFSLKDLIEINEYSLIVELQKCFEKFEKHILHDCNVRMEVFLMFRFVLIKEENV